MICPNCGKTVADIATTCPECRCTIGPMDPEVQAELIAQRKEEKRSRADAGRGGASRALAPLRLFAVLVTIAVIFAGTAGIPRLTRGRIKLAPRITTLEETIAKAHGRWFSKRRSTNANYLLYLGFLGIAVLAVWQAADAFQQMTGQPSGSIVGMTVAVLMTVVLGLFAARLKMEIFHPAGRLDWMMNGMSFAFGAIIGVAANWKRR